MGQTDQNELSGIVIIVHVLLNILQAHNEQDRGAYVVSTRVFA
jgi:hypothetical protein